MADITLNIAAGRITPIEEDVARGESLSVAWEGLAAWHDSLAIESGFVSVTQFDALDRVIKRETLTDYSSGFSFGLEPGTAVIEFDLKGRSSFVGGGGLHELSSTFPVKVGGAGSGGSAEPQTWREFRAAVRNGSITDYLDAGDSTNVSESGVITASVDGDNLSNISVVRDTFLNKVGTDNATYQFDYNGTNWELEGSAVTLQDYGITITGTPAQDDTATVRYAASNAVYDCEGVDEEVPVNPAHTHELSLIRRDVVGLIAFDPPQYLFAVTEEACTAFGWPSTGMPAGTYNIMLDHAAYNSSTTEDTTVQFTTTQIVPVGGGIRHTQIGAYRETYAKATMLAGTFITYRADRITTLETGLATTEGSAGTSLGTTTANNPTYLSGDYINFSQRQMYGSSRWKTSFIRQMLNSEDASVTFVPGTIWSRPVASSVEGFRHVIDPELNAVLGPVRKRYARNIADGYGYDDCEDYVTLATMLDVFGQQNNSISEGPVNASGQVTRTVAKSLWKNILTTNADRIKVDSTSTARYWWLSSTNPSNASLERRVDSSGALNNDSANNSGGVVPVLHII